MDESDFRDLLFGGADRDINLIGRRTELMQTAQRGNEDDRAEAFCISGIERDCI
jgi:hypothetical protein